MKTRRGSALLWALVIIAMFTAVITALLPYAAQANDLNTVAETATILRNVAAAVRKFDSTVTRSAGNYMLPNRLNQLSTTVANNGQAGCVLANNNDLYTNTSVTNWSTYGPYGPYQMTTTGLWTPMGRLNDAPSQVSSAIGTNRTAITDAYFIQIPNVNADLAELLDSYVDHTAGATADTVQYTSPPAADNTVTLSWRVFLLNSAC